MRRFVPILLFAVICPAFFPRSTFGGQIANQNSSKSTTEITKDDFTKLATIRSTDLTVFGLKLGDSLSDAKGKVEHSHLRLKPAGFRNGFRVYEQGGHSALFVFDTEDERVVKIALFEGMAKYLAGEARLLYEENVTEPDSPVRLKLLGREDRRSVEVSSIGHTVTCSYDKEGLRLIRSFSQYGDALPVIHLVFPAKSR